jgi:hypothetical protein
MKVGNGKAMAVMIARPSQGLSSAAVRANIFFQKLIVVKAAA